MRAPAAWIVAAVVAASTSSCADVDPASGRRVDGPLVARAASGGQSLHPPKAGTWWASYGGLQVCTTGPTVTLEDVRLTGPDTAVEQRIFVYRTRGEHYMGFWGAAPDWKEPYASVDDPADDVGHYDPVPGAQVTELCDERRKGEPWPEVVLVMRTDAEGLATDGYWIDYLADGEHYTVRMPWEITLCDAARQREHCERD